MKAWCEEFWLRPARAGCMKKGCQNRWQASREGGSMRAEASVPRSIGNGRECMVYQNFHFFLALSTTHEVRRGERGGCRAGFLSLIVDLLVFLSPHVTSRKKCTPPQPQGSVTAQISLEEVLRYHYGIKFPSFSVLPEEVLVAGLTAHTHSHHHNTTHYGISAR